MPPSPAMRCSPGRELRAQNHKRGRSLEGGILFKEKADDLALFTEMQTKEKDNFLLQSNDDFEDVFSTKLRYFSDYKLGISIPAHGESSDLLNGDGEKNDYDWLLTPPDTPLFPSLDDETPPVNLAHRGRPRSKPISISRSSTMEKSYRSSRGSASPNRLSPSPRSESSTFQSRGRASSAPHSSPTAPHSSPTPSLHQVTPSRRPSPLPNKSPTQAPRSSTPTPRRMSTVSSGSTSSSGVRGTSPVKTSRGNSASPKIRAWQSNIPGFSLEAPPNLRTSLADRPASYVRGSSPASRNGRESSCRSGRQSMSPTASRSVSSSYSHDRDRYSSHSKGSIVSSGDDDVDSLQSIPTGSSDPTASRRVGAFPNNRALTLSKKSSRTVSSSSAPKRSFDSALRQMDRRKGPQNMFRPLLSSVPSSTFYVGKASAAHRAMISRNSSVTTSSNASSDQGTSAAHDTEGSEQNQDNMISECGKASFSDVQDEIFAFDNVDDVHEVMEHEIHDGSPNIQHDDFNGVTSQFVSTENLDHNATAIAISKISDAMDAKGDFSEVNSLEDVVLCSRCLRRYSASVLIEGDVNLCPQCSKSDGPITITTPLTATVFSENCPHLSMRITEENKSFDASEPLMAVLESPEMTDVGATRVFQNEHSVNESQTSFGETSESFVTDNCLAEPLMKESYQRLANQQVVVQSTVGHSLPDSNSRVHQIQQFTDSPGLKTDVSEGAGISILLKRSSSGKGPAVQGRTFIASVIPYSDPSYVRDSANSMRSPLGLGNTSASSSVDLGSARQTEICVQRQLSGRKSDMENNRYDMSTKHQRTGSSLSGTSNHAFQALGVVTNTNEEKIEVSVAHMEKDAADLIYITPQEKFLTLEDTEVDAACTQVDCNNDCQAVVVSTSELSTYASNLQLGDRSVASLSNFEDSASHGNEDDLKNNARSISDIEISAITPEFSTIVENTMSNSGIEKVCVPEVPHEGSLDIISEIETEKDHPSSPCSHSDVESPHSRSGIDEIQKPSVPTASDMDITASVAESDTSDHAHEILEESTITLEGQGGTKTRSLTLDEATDTILFCSSIIHNLAYEAATIAMEKENLVPLEGSRPTVTILGNSNTDRKDPRGRSPGKRASKSQKSRQRHMETNTKSFSGDTENEETTEVSTTRIVGVPNKSDSMKPPKLESKCNCTVM